ncbi:ankyrin repeat and SOCS box protein 18 isoform X2 [Microcaecilia unicolor]|uniref:Ankyrin repeat and SOCS box protein 18 isoform X2 n=1 Tax=Microcaecilia unicolor TaxID=1415580 RepID=A0A6P7YMW3_9AMPH|nr:ankyrin repeat and SOCS box protein 18 isoform X2 [Microcaecilia unicolor]
MLSHQDRDIRDHHVSEGYNGGRQRSTEGNGTKISHDDISILNCFCSGDLEMIQSLFHNSLDIVNATLSIESDELRWSCRKTGLWSLEYKRELTNPLCITAKCGYADCLLYLLQRRADPNAAPGGKSPLHEACLEGHKNCVELLLEYRSNPNLLNDDGLAPLHLCTTKQSYQCAKLLIKYGALVNQPSEETEDTPLHIAAKHGLHEHVLLYLRYGASVDSMNSSKETPLNVACGDAKELKHQENYLKVCKLLLAHGANVNTQDEEKKSPLHKACKNASHCLVQWLLENQADVNAIDYNGISPMACVLQTAAFKQDLMPHLNVQSLLNHGSHKIWPGAFFKVLASCAAVPKIIEILVNSYDFIRITEKWVDAVPEDMFQMHLPFYESLFALSCSTRCLQHMCRCAIRKQFANQCHHLIPLLPIPKSLQKYLLLEPEGLIF